jgi:transposase-like protein
MCARPRSGFSGFRFPAEVMVVAVRWYMPYVLSGWYMPYGWSCRDVKELLAERGIEVDHVTVYRWVQRFMPLLADAAQTRTSRHRTDFACPTGRASCPTKREAAVTTSLSAASTHPR